MCKIVFIGSGNVATHLSLEMQKQGMDIVQIYSRNENNASILASRLKTEYVCNVESIIQNADLYIVAIVDNAVENIAARLKIKHGIVVHTAGSVPMQIFEGKFEKYGVFYPLQTFSKEISPDFENIPLCIEANSVETENFILEIAKKISRNVSCISSDQRKIVHLAAVFACNFSNYMYHLSYSLLEKYEIDFKILKPLITETAAKVQNNIPKEMQTGPASRNDFKTIENHIDSLKELPELQEIYKFLTNKIQKL